MDVFIAALRETAIVRYACDKADISRDTAYAWRKKYKTFADRWADALEDATDTLEAIARARATRKSEPSDRLLVLLLKAHRPDRFGDKTEVNQKTTGEITFRVVYGDDGVKDDGS